jgi:hypothetical protein
MGFAVLHISKGAGGGGAIGNHIDREDGKEHSYRNADPSKKSLNRHIFKDKNGQWKANITADKVPLEKRIKERIDQGFNGKRKIRTDAVKYLQIILSGSHEDMKNIEKSKSGLENWTTENLKFIAQKYGEDNIVRFTLHMDETTPHIHAVIVPLTKDGRLSAKDVMGDHEELSKLQTEYANAMKPFGLERGLEGSRAKHDSVKEYYARVNQAEQNYSSPLHKPDNATQIAYAKLKNEFKVEVPGRFDNLEKWANNQTIKMVEIVQPIIDDIQKQTLNAKQAEIRAKAETDRVRHQLFKNPSRIAQKVGLMKKELQELERKSNNLQKNPNTGKSR